MPSATLVALFLPFQSLSFFFLFLLPWLGPAIPLFNFQDQAALTEFS